LAGNSKIKLVVLNTHPIQYFAPLYKKIADDENIDLMVLYCSRWGLDDYVDQQFSQKFKWDIPLLEGYKSKFLKNIRNTQDVNRFFNLINLEVIKDLIVNRYDVLWLNGHNSLTNIIAIVTAKLLRIKLLMRAETQLNVEPLKIKKLIRKPVMQLFYKMFDGFLYIGTRNKEYYKYLGIQDKKLFFVPYTVDNEFFKVKTEIAKINQLIIKRKFDIKNDNLNIIFASKLLKRKNPMMLLKAFENISTRMKNINLIFAGSGEEEIQLKEYTKQKNIDNVYFTGFLNQSKLPELFAIADVFVLPSINEQWGLIINEAMCAGLPIIATDVIGAVPDLVKNGENGFSFPAGDLEQLSEKLYYILNDNELKIRMGNTSAEIIQNWSYSECLIGIKKALETLLN
jgi:glycosyltransferase involved in cell wall biosynthesis